MGYHETLWNTGGAPREVYKVHWNELDEIKLKAAKDLGYNEASWEEDAFLSENEEEGMMMGRGRRRQRTGPDYI